ncbi:MAG: archease [Anaerolineales bacterium]
MPTGGFEELEHTADWALRVRGRDLAELLVNAANGMMELAGVQTSAGAGPERKLELTSPDRESLLVDWLHELLLALELRSVAFKHIRLAVTGDRGLIATFQEVPLISIAKPIKAVTYNELNIVESPQGLSTTVVFDV